MTIRILFSPVFFTHKNWRNYVEILCDTCGTIMSFTKYCIKGRCCSCEEKEKKFIYPLHEQPIIFESKYDYEKISELYNSIMVGLRLKNIRFSNIESKFSLTIFISHPRKEVTSSRLIMTKNRFHLSGCFLYEDDNLIFSGNGVDVFRKSLKIL